jgi:aminoglycoside 3-N-acetyltransferase
MPTRPSITRPQIEQGLRNLGLKAGDVVLLHSSVWSLGTVEGGPPAVIGAFFAVLGDSGTLAVPAFGDFGVLPRLIRDHPQAVQSLQLPGRIAAVGPHADRLCRDHELAETAHGKNTPYTRIAELDGYVCLLGVDQDRNTTLHSAEALLELPYLRDETFEYQAADGSTQTRTFKHYPGPHRDFIGLDRRLREAGIVKVGRIGRAEVRLMPSRDLIAFGVELGRKDPAFVLCDNPSCADCVAQRAALRRHRLQGEPFTLGASASLAGRCVSEMIDNLANCGLAHLEFDRLQGTPVQAAEAEAVRLAVEQLRQESVTVIALRCPGVPEDPEPLCQLAEELQIPRLVLPLTGDARRTLDAARSRGVAISLCNVLHDSAAVCEMFSGLESVGLTYSPCGFARSGENPFLKSLGASKARRCIDQLDIEDCRYDGTPTALGRGNAEIKELISILRCGGFDGTFVLSSHNRHVGTLPQIVEQFDDLLGSL